ncbi:MAG: aminopeptidase, partial [Candidatus Eisenbacteria sp.]|nr:aminopeptidase [Candidatus Eisenbacteria bacterium]
GTMNHLIGRKVMEMGLELRSLSRDGAFEKELRERKEGMLAEVYRMLVLNLGQPPREFTWRYEKSDSTDIATYPEPLTPKAFYEEVIDIELSAYVALFNYPGKDYYENYALEMSRNIYDRPNLALLNVPIDSIKACALRSILDSTAVWFACDVGKENYGKEGIMMLDIYNYDLIYGTEFEMAKKDLIELGMITPNHAMALVGVDTVSTRATKWLVENSWGEDDGDSGMWHMYNDWFDCYLFGAVIHQKYLSDELIEFSRKDPILLPPWDPMYALNHLE